MSPYSVALDPAKKEIRQLILQPLKDGLEIHCSTETISLLESPGFEALSYVWGNASIQQSITFNGITFSVTQNLAIALRYLRLPEKPRKIWIDALCINQKDTSERNSQVAMMGEIYANANPVLIWLGESSNTSDEAFGLMSQVVHSKEIVEKTSQKLFSFYLELVEREWFTRLWTIQELVLANQDPLVGCGHTWTTWSTLFGVWQKIAMTEFSKMGMVISEEVGAGVRPNATKIDLLNNLRRASVAEERGEGLQDLLLNTASANATEPRDRIYGLIGMLSEEDRQCITVDYNRPLGTLFAEAIALVFQKGKGAFLLSGMELAGPTPSDISFPSWVPMFGSKSLLSPTRFHPPGIGVSGPGYEAINGTVDTDLKTLRIRGLPIDVVVDKIEFNEGMKCLAQLPQVEVLAGKARELAASHSKNRPYLNSFKTKEPLWRTLITNKAYSGAARELAPESYEEMYKQLLENQQVTSHNENEYGGSTRDYQLSLLNHLPASCFFITSTGFCGIGPRFIEKGDHLVIWFGAPAPFILRQKVKPQDTQGGPIYAVCGVAYVAGIMNGEVVDEVYCEDLEEDIIYVIQ